MARVKPDWAIPRQGSGKFSQLDHIREHQQVALAAAWLAKDALVIGWNLTAVTRNSSGFPFRRFYVQPETGYQLRITNTYLGVVLEETLFEANVGSGYEPFDPPKLDYVFDGTQRLTSTQWAN